MFIFDENVILRTLTSIVFINVAAVVMIDVRMNEARKNRIVSLKAEKER